MTFHRSRGQDELAQRQIKVGLLALDPSLSVKDIAKKLNCKEHTIRADLTALGMPRRQHTRKKAQNDEDPS
ncbi:hypothetical protein SEA_FORZA_35 [Gordonia phage Forza]|uniref:Helix-turn-helix DNA binding domain protein n=1 Tax=Gordonia phage Forza TaxID=2571247 RepID=A0A650EZD9_9CAUD|nr:hypothetical protein PP303_gp035 [Gordonia phage Forza]QEM41505.1 LamD-like [Gordonia phage Boopy]QGT55028.1 hypothetical protein SEA_FORZA_35 [Gordonia phage Forza]UXE04178.1 helix-turn-helix DNA binding domain protein [Gordonia phage BlueNGold]WBF03817.1 hypothetical protein SEA_MAREELIH_34 [Gordonia phage Mareelih]